MQTLTQPSVTTGRRQWWRDYGGDGFLVAHRHMRCKPVLKIWIAGFWWRRRRLRRCRRCRRRRIRWGRARRRGRRRWRGTLTIWTELGPFSICLRARMEALVTTPHCGLRPIALFTADAPWIFALDLFDGTAPAQFPYASLWA